MRAALLIALLALFVASHGRFPYQPTSHGLRLSSQLHDLQEEEQQLSAENERMRAVIGYLGTEEGQLLAARSELHMVEPQERLLLVSEPPESSIVRLTSLGSRTRDLVSCWARQAQEDLEAWGAILHTWYHLEAEEPDPAETPPTEAPLVEETMDTSTPPASAPTPD
jgi:hypothetical protein